MPRNYVNKNNKCKVCRKLIPKTEIICSEECVERYHKVVCQFCGKLITINDNYDINKKLTRYCKECLGSYSNLYLNRYYFLRPFDEDMAFFLGILFNSIEAYDDNDHRISIHSFISTISYIKKEINLDGVHKNSFIKKNKKYIKYIFKCKKYITFFIENCIEKHIVDREFPTFIPKNFEKFFIQGLLSDPCYNTIDEDGLFIFRSRSKKIALYMNDYLKGVSFSTEMEKSYVHKSSYYICWYNVKYKKRPF